MAETKNLKLYTTPSDDTTTPLKEWVQKIAGETDSNMTKIDAEFEKIAEELNKVSDKVAGDLQGTLSVLDSRLKAEEKSTIEMKAAIQKEVETDRNAAIAKAVSDEAAARSQAINNTNTVVGNIDVRVEKVESALGLSESSEEGEETIVDKVTTLEADVAPLKVDVQGLKVTTGNTATGLTSLTDRVNRLETKPTTSFDEVVFEEDARLLYIKLNGENVVDPVSIPCKGNVVFEGVVSTAYAQGSTNIAVGLGNGCSVSVYYRCVSYNSNGEAEEFNGDGASIKYYLDDDVEPRAVVTPKQGPNPFEVPALWLTEEGVHTLIAKVTDGQAEEDAKTRTVKWSITVKSISFTCELDDTDWKTGPVSVVYYPFGIGVLKTTKFFLDVEDYTTAEPFAQQETNKDTDKQTLIIDAQSHGAHTLTMYTEAVIGGVTVKSEPKHYSLMWVDENSDQPIVSIKRNYEQPQQYTTSEFKYMVYDPTSLTTSVELFVNGEPYRKDVADRNLQDWNFTPMVGDAYTLKVVCGTAEDSITFDPIDSKVEIEEVTDTLIWKFDPDGRNNTSENRDEWSYGNVSMSIPDDFRWSRGGWGVDNDGYPCFTVPAGNRVSFNSDTFRTDWKETGHNLKIIFKATGVSNYDAEVATCMTGNLGLTITAQSATLNTRETTSDADYTPLTVHLCEDRYTELEWNITSKHHYSEVVCWVQGVPSIATNYSDTDIFQQAPVAPLVFGSDECDVHIYMIREYSTYLSDDEIFGNWIADSPSGDIMLDRYNRNDFIKTGADVNSCDNLDLAVLAEKCPDLRVITLDCPKLSHTNEEEGEISGCTVTHTLWNGGKMHCWRAENVTHKVQGTSSVGYGESAFNLDFDFKKSTFVFDALNEDGTNITSSGYAMTDNSIPVNYFNLKVNVTSSEGANNACLADDYQEFNAYRRDARSDPRVRDTMEFHPCVLFVKDRSGALFGDTEFHFYAAGDFGNSKKNFEAQGLGLGETADKECIIELMNNLSDICKWRSDDLTNEPWLGNDDSALGFRYPKVKDEDVLSESTKGYRDSFQRVLSWVVSTKIDFIPDADGSLVPTAPDTLLEEAVTINGVEYLVDSVEYRRAKFRAEFDDYFIRDSVFFYYLFTERHLMTDNRAKNTFWHTVDGLKWDLCFDYDNDTALGCNNTGELTFTYGLEDTDRVPGESKFVYNGYDSVLFCNVRDCFPNELKSMFHTCETAGAWDANRLLAKMEAYQAIKPERIWITDMRRKYLRPWEENGTSGYLNMLHGRKDLQRTQFELYQMDYCASKYFSPNCQNDKIWFRSYYDPSSNEVRSVNIELAMYIDCYVCVKLGNYSYSYRAKRGEIKTITHSISSVNDAETYIYLAGRVQEIGNLADTYLDRCTVSNAVKLQHLTISPYVDQDGDLVNYSNPNIRSIAVTNCTLLKSLTACCCPNLLDIEGLNTCPRLETVDFRGSGVASVSFADGGYLRQALLPDTVAIIFARNLMDLKVLKVLNHEWQVANPTLTPDSVYGKIKRLWVENCPSLTASLDGESTSLLSLVTGATGLEYVRLIGIDWTMNDSSVLMRLSPLRGINADGSYDVDPASAVVTGTANINSIGATRLSKLMERYPGLDIIYEEPLAAELTVRFLNEDGSVLHTQKVEYGADAEDPVLLELINVPTKMSSEYYDYTFDKWSEPFVAVVADMDIYATYTSSTRQYTVTWKNGIEVLDVMTVDAGTAVSYEKSDIIVKPGYVWTGFEIDPSCGPDANPNNVLTDIILRATFIALAKPAENRREQADQFDYMYSDDHGDKMAYSFGELAWILSDRARISDYLPNSQTDIPCRIKMVNTRPDLLSDVNIVFELHSTKHYRLKDDDDFAISTWFMVGLLGQSRRMSNETNAGGYFASEIDKWLTETVYPSLPTHWRSIIKAVEVYANDGSPQYNVGNPQLRHLYLPSIAEIGYLTGTTPYSEEVDPDAGEIVFEQYVEINQRIKRLGGGTGEATGEAKYYWTRSAAQGESNSFKVISGTGGSTSSTVTHTSRFICFGFSV